MEFGLPSGRKSSDAAPSILTSALTTGVTLLLDAGTLACYQQSPEGYTSPRVMPRHIRALTLTKGLVRTLQGHQQSSWRTPVLKPSSNSGLPIAWITAPATDASLNQKVLQDIKKSFEEVHFTRKYLLRGYILGSGVPGTPGVTPTTYGTTFISDIL